MNPSLIHFGILLLAIACFLTYFSVVLMKKKNNPAETNEPEEPNETPEPPVKEVPLNPWEQHVAEEVERGALTPEEAELVYDMSDVLLPIDCDYETMIERLDQDANYRTNLTLDPKESNNHNENAQQFKKFILKKLNRGVFRPLTPDELTEKANTIYEDHRLLPPILLSLYRKETRTLIALDLKWTARKSRKGISACRKHMLANYKLFERKTGIPVFIVVGIGNTASDPEQLAILPVRELTSSFIPHHLLDYYEKDPQESFRYDDLNRKIR